MDSFTEHIDKPKTRFPLVRFDQVKTDTSVRYLVKPLIPSIGMTLIWGRPKCGKSFWAFDLLMHVALGWRYRDRKVRQGIVVYIVLEGAEGFKARIAAFRQRHELDGHVVPFYLISVPVDLIADRAALIASIRGQLGDKTPIAAVAIDTLNRSLSGSESSDEDMAAYVKAADALRDAFEAAILIIHHCGHSGDRPRGHSALLGAVDAQIAVTRDSSDNIVATLEVAKDGPSGEVIVSRLEQVDVGIDNDGDVITSCIVEPAEGPAEAASRADRMSKPARIALDALKDAVLTVGSPAPQSEHIPAGITTVTMEQWRQYSYSRGVSTSGEARAKQIAFKRASESLLVLRHVAIWENHVWLC